MQAFIAHFKQKTFAFFCSSVVIITAFAQEPEITVVGLSQDTAIIVFNDHYHVLHPGETLTGDITLVSADSEKAILEINGQESIHHLSQRISREAYSTPKTPPIRIFPDSQGLYSVAGQINGYAVDFIVDTGATVIAMSSKQAQRMGIHHYRRQGQAGVSSTAAGNVRSYQIALAHVKVGHLSQDNVTAVIIEGEHPHKILLGMSFLKHIQLSRNGKVLELRQSKEYR
ncbi:MAG: retropepsin-like aspartic protease [Pseudomonadota bacterium]|nr:retropepsin-like aspartic protease [Pseudomonadota bacterium]